ncbi:MAG: hypothetical protein AAGU05_09760, partial [Anaerolineaceae bacterium]
PFGSKLRILFSEYLQGLNPLYWFVPNDKDFVRHLMKGYGHLWRPSLPFFALGFGVLLWRIRRPEYRVLLAAVLAAPAGAALVAVGITRVLFMVIPAALITALGLSTALAWAQRKWRAAWLPGLIFLLLAAANIGMLADALRNGPLWFRDYGLGGMQYGARQIFPAIRTYLDDHPGTRLTLSPSWANGTNEIARFFFDDPQLFQMGSIAGYLDERRPLDDGMVFVMIPEEYEMAQASGKFKEILVDQVLPFPDGLPGFYFTRLRYVDDIDAILAAEKSARQVLQSGQVSVLGGEARVEYSHLDMGGIGDLFDGDPGSMVRTLEANPLRLDVYFDQPKTLSTLTLRVGGVPTRVTARLFGIDGREPLTVTREAAENWEPRNLELALDAPVQVLRVEIEVLNIRDGEPAHVHLWEVTFK